MYLSILECVSKPLKYIISILNLNVIEINMKQEPSLTAFPDCDASLYLFYFYFLRSSILRPSKAWLYQFPLPATHSLQLLATTSMSVHCNLLKTLALFTQASSSYQRVFICPPSIPTTRSICGLSGQFSSCVVAEFRYDGAN